MIQYGIKALLVLCKYSLLACFDVFLRRHLCMHVSASFPRKKHGCEDLGCTSWLLMCCTHLHYSIQVHSIEKVSFCLLCVQTVPPLSRPVNQLQGTSLACKHLRVCRCCCQNDARLTLSICCHSLQAAEYGVNLSRICCELA